MSEQFQRHCRFVIREKAHGKGISTGSRSPEHQKRTLKVTPEFLQSVENPNLVFVSVAALCRMAILGKIGQQQVGHEGADIKAHRAVDREFGVDYARILRRHHDRSRVQVPMQHRLAAGEEHPFQVLHRNLEFVVLAKLDRDRIELRRCPTIERRHPVWIREDQILRYLAKLRVQRKHRLMLALEAGGNGEIGGRKKRLGGKRGNVLRQFWVAHAADHALAQYDVWLQQLHDYGRLARCEMIDFRHQAPHHMGLCQQRLVLEMRAIQRQRPAFANQPHIGQCLFDANPASWSLDDKDEVEVAVADFAHGPSVRRTAEHLHRRRHAGEKHADACGRQRRIVRSADEAVGDRGGGHAGGLWSARSRQTAQIASASTSCSGRNLASLAKRGNCGRGAVVSLAFTPPLDRGRPWRSAWPCRPSRSL